MHLNLCLDYNMFQRDNINIEVDIYPDRGGNARLNEYVSWLYQNNIKYSLVRNPEWATHPTAINMRNEDALMFKLVFGL